MSSTLIRISLFVSLFATSVFGHTALNFPTPRGPKQTYIFDKPGNACENTNTALTEPAVFKRGQSIDPSWWWNNHKGGFVKFAVVKGTAATIDNKVFLDNKNIIGGQCYTGGCDQNGFDPGFTHLCKGKPMVIPDWLADGEYTLQFSHIGGFDSFGIPTKLLPLYHNCANIKIAGGVAFKAQPANWIAPFTGGSQDVINGKKGGADVCGFKQFDAEPADPKAVDTAKNEKVADMKFGKPAGWAITGKTQGKREENVKLARLGRVAAVHRRSDDEDDDEMVEIQQQDIDNNDDDDEQDVERRSDGDDQMENDDEEDEEEVEDEDDE
jgi:hypothetical protein